MRQKLSQSRRAISIAVIACIVIVVIVIGVTTLMSPQQSSRLKIGFTFPNTLVTSPDLSSMNYTLLIVPAGNLPKNLSLSVVSSKGLTASIAPSNITMDVVQPPVTLSIAVSNGTPPGRYQITIQAKGNRLTFSQNEQVTVLKYLVVTINTTFVPKNLTVLQGSSVTWLRLNGALSEYDNGAHDVDFSSGTSVVSPTLNQYQSWSYTFSETGNYSYYCKYHPFMTGDIEVISQS